MIYWKIFFRGSVSGSSGNVSLVVIQEETFLDLIQMFFQSVIQSRVLALQTNKRNDTLNGVSLEGNLILLTPNVILKSK